MDNCIKIKNTKHDVEMSIGSQCGTGYELVALKDVDDEDFYTFPVLKGETELGIYTAQLVHGVNGSKLETLKLDFTPHK